MQVMRRRTEDEYPEDPLTDDELKSRQAAVRRQFVDTLLAEVEQLNKLSNEFSSLEEARKSSSRKDEEAIVEAQRMLFERSMNGWNSFANETIADFDAVFADMQSNRVGYTAVKASILAADNSLNDIDAINTNVQASLKAMRRKQLVYASVSTTQVNSSIALAVAQLQKLAALTRKDASDVSKIPAALTLIKEEAKQKFDDLSSSEPAYQIDADTITQNKNDADSYAKSAKMVADHAQAVQKIAATIAVSPDPPIDSVLHSVQFVVAYGASATPSWTLIQWKGPGLNGPALSGQGQRTHILQLALGPRAASDKTTAEQARLIQNTTVLLSRP
jgi:hypothetical protein